ncbi:MAG: DUF3575 domain-containing protein [Bacteroidota bacterium]
MKNLFIVFGLLLFAGPQLLAQENIIKLRLGQLAARKIELTYERVISDNQSFVISAGVRFPRNTVPGVFSGATSDTSVFVADELDFAFNGFSITPEYRFYLGSEGAPYKFYIGPYLRYRRWGYGLNAFVEYTNNGQPDQADVRIKGSWSGIGGGVGIGMQWLINDVIAIDWNIVGLGVSYQAFKFTSQGTNPNEDWAAVRDRLDEAWQDVPIIQDRFELTEADMGVDANFGFLLPSLRANLSIGYAF